MSNFSVEIVLRLKSDDGRTESDVARLYHGEISSPGAALRVGRDSMEALEYSIAREVATEEEQAKREADPAPPQHLAGMDFANTGDGPTVVFMGDLPRGGEPTGLGALLAQLGLVQRGGIPDQRRFRTLPEDLNHPLFHDIKRHPANRRDYQYPPQKLQDNPDAAKQQFVEFGFTAEAAPVPFPQYLTNDADPRPADTQPPMASGKVSWADDLSSPLTPREPFAEGGPDVAPAGSLAPDCTGEIGCPKHAPDGGNHPVAGTPGE